MILWELKISGGPGDRGDSGLWLSGGVISAAVRKLAGAGGQVWVTQGLLTPFLPAGALALPVLGPTLPGDRSLEEATVITVFSRAEEGSH